MCEQDQESRFVTYYPSSYARELTDAIQDTLKMHDPLHRNVVYDKVRACDTHVGHAKPVNSIGSYLSTDKPFKNADKGNWNLQSTWSPIPLSPAKTRPVVASPTNPIAVSDEIKNGQHLG